MPFRRLCASFGAEATMSEMSYARNLVKGNVVEKTHLRQAANEDCFGEQQAKCQPHTYAQAPTHTPTNALSNTSTCLHN